MTEGNNSTIMAVLLDKRTAAAPMVQEVLTKYGCIISTRIGLHQLRECTEEGLIILHLLGDEEEIAKLKKELAAIYRVKVETMQIAFDD